MKILLACLMCLVLFKAECFAISGGPVYTKGNIKATGTYAGVLMPDSAEIGINSLGIFTVQIPQTGLGTGTVVLFARGEAYTGTFQGIADPDTAKISGSIDTGFDYEQIVTSTDSSGTITTTTVTVRAEAAGLLSGKIKPDKNRLSTSSARIKGSADIQFSLTVGKVDEEIIYDVSGFKQSSS